MRGRSSFLQPTQSNSSCDQLRDDGARQLNEQPDADHLEGLDWSARQRQQAQNDQPEAEIIRFGDRVQARQRIRETEQADRSREKEEGAGYDGKNSEYVEQDVLGRLVSSATSLSPPDVALLTKATAANAASSASISATSTMDGVSVVIDNRRRPAMLSVPSSCAAMRRSVSPGRTKMPTSPRAAIPNTNPAVPIRKLVIVLHASERAHK